jgi:hypothetical protein
MCKYRVATFPLLLLLTAGLVLIPSLVHAQSLADVAKKEQERRKQQGEKGKVYTNKDLASVPPSSVPPAPEPAPSSSGGDAASQPPRSDDKGASGSKTDGSKTDGGKADNADKSSAEKDKAKDPAYWAERKKGLQATLDRDSTFADALQSKINALTTDFVNRDDPAQRTVIERNRQKALADLEGLKKQIVADKKALADFEEEARRAGVPPGWLR